MLFLSGGACFLNKIQEKVWPSEQNEPISEHNPPDVTEIKKEQEVDPNRGHKNWSNEPDRSYDLSGMGPNILEQEPYDDSSANRIKIKKDIYDHLSETQASTNNIFVYLPQKGLTKDNQRASDGDDLKADDAYTAEGSNIDTVKDHDQTSVVHAVSPSAEKEHKQAEKPDEEKYGMCAKPSCRQGDDCNAMCIHQWGEHNPGCPICRKAVQKKILEPHQVYNPEQLQQIPKEMGIDDPASPIDPMQTEQEHIGDENETLVQQVKASMPQTVTHSQQEPSQEENNESIKQTQEEEEPGQEIEEDKEEERGQEKEQKEAVEPYTHRDGLSRNR
ncbi:hypothetical protein [Candidatus Cardinium sp. cBcalN1]|nr:hypothetical protein [Candidatus Cardinium sp. cBcalN1]